MIISRARRFIFVHIPKTGGTALTLALEAKAAKEDILIGDTPKARRRAGRWKGVKSAGRLWKHSTLADLPGLLTEDEIAQMQAVTMIRNPWDRMVSYYHWLRDQHFAHPAVGLSKTHDFSGFLNHPQTQTALRMWPYGRYLTRCDGTEQPAILIRLEHVVQDLAPFEAHLGFKLTLTRVNASDRDRDWRGFYSDADAALLADLCADDIARFGYRFDPETLG